MLGSLHSHTGSLFHIQSPPGQLHPASGRPPDHCPELQLSFIRFAKEELDKDPWAGFGFLDSENQGTCEEW